LYDALSGCGEHAGGQQRDKDAGQDNEESD